MKRLFVILPLAWSLVACTPQPAAGPAVDAEKPPARAAETQPPELQPEATKPDIATSRSAPVTSGIPSKIPMPAAGTPTPALAPAAAIAYVCENGDELRVSYQGIVAQIAWTGGKTLVLSRSGRGDTNGEAYVGDGHTLLRRGNVVELKEDDGAYSRRCAESGASA